jgi:hypothetical protein
MYWSSELFAKKKGKYGWIWIAGFLCLLGCFFFIPIITCVRWAGTSFRRVPPSVIKGADIGAMCEGVIGSEVPLALRMQAILIHGISRIQNKKAYFYVVHVSHASFVLKSFGNPPK